MANDIGWGQGAVDNGIGWGQGAINNDINWGDIYYSTDAGETDIIGSDAPIVMEKYLIYDCISGEQFDTELYEVGEFEINDRVVFNNNQYNTFGKVIEITENIDFEFSIGSIGVNSDQCFDNSITLTSGNEVDETYIDFSISLNSTNADFISSNKEYSMNVNYFNYTLVLVYISPGEGEEPYYDQFEIEFSGSSNFDNYYYEQGGDYEIAYRRYTFADYISPIEFYDQEIYISVGFDNTDSYNEDGCPSYVFWRTYGSQTGSTFNMIYRNDNC